MPEIGGEAAPGFEGVREAFAANLAGNQEVGAAVSVYLHGRKVVDLWGGIADPENGRRWERDTLQVVYSTSKAVTAACAQISPRWGQSRAEQWGQFRVLRPRRGPERHEGPGPVSALNCHRKPQ